MWNFVEKQLENGIYQIIDNSNFLPMIKKFIYTCINCINSTLFVLFEKNISKKSLKFWSNFIFFGNFHAFSINIELYEKIDKMWDLWLDTGKEIQAARYSG